MGMLRYKYRVADKILELITERGTEEQPLTSGVMADILREDGVPIGAMTSALANMVKTHKHLHRRKVADPDHSSKMVYGYWINKRVRNGLAKGPATRLTKRNRSSEPSSCITLEQFAAAVTTVNLFQKQFADALELKIEGKRLRALMMREFK